MEQAKTDPLTTITKSSVAKRTAEFKSLRNILLAIHKRYLGRCKERNQESCDFPPILEKLA
jgi:hypothetical protein